MMWNRSETIALAGLNCIYCQGLGLCRGRDGDVPCSCVTRAIFRVCNNRFRSCVEKDRGASIVRLERIGYGHSTHMAFGRKNEEYIADFYLVCKRTLNENEWRIFNWAYLLGADWSLCHKRLNMSRSHFIHACQRMEAKLGKGFRETAPFALFPLDEYFSPTSRATVAPCTPPDTRPQRSAMVA